MGGGSGASKSANGKQGSKEVALRFPSLPPPHPGPGFPLHPQAQLLHPPSDIFVSWSSSFTLIRSKVSFLLCLLSLSCT